MKIVITGGAGFIGSHLATELIRKKHQVKIIDDLSTGTLENLSGVKNKIDFKLGDIKNFNFLRQEFLGEDVLFHLAAKILVGESVKYPKLYHQVNATGTLNVLLAARQAKIKKVIIASSCAVYGDSRQQKIKETQVLNPASPYALTKMISENYGLMFSRLYQLPVIILRYFNVYGQPWPAKSNYAAVITTFRDQLSKKQPAIIYGNGRQTRDFIYVDDVVTANLCALRAPDTANGQIFNIGSGKATTIIDLYQLMAKIMGQSHRQPIFKPERAGNIHYSCADISKAKKILNYQPQINLANGLKKI